MTSIHTRVLQPAMHPDFVEHTLNLWEPVDPTLRRRLHRFVAPQLLIPRGKHHGHSPGAADVVKGALPDLNARLQLSGALKLHLRKVSNSELHTTPQ